MPVNTAGISAPPAKPWMTRNTTSEAKFPEKAQPSEATVNTKVAMANSQRSVSTRISQPVSGIAITSAMR